MLLQKCTKPQTDLSIFKTSAVSCVAHRPFNDSFKIKEITFNEVVDVLAGFVYGLTVNLK